MSPPPKPPYGSPCNSCGLCCLLQQCPVSTSMFGEATLCPAIQQIPGGGLTCGLIASPDRFFPEAGDQAPLIGEAIGVMLGAGTGCDGVVGEADHELAEKERPDLHARAMAHLRAQRPEIREIVYFLSGQR